MGPLTKTRTLAYKDLENKVQAIAEDKLRAAVVGDTCEPRDKHDHDHTGAGGAYLRYTKAPLVALSLAERVASALQYAQGKTDDQRRDDIAAFKHVPVFFAG